MHAKIIYSLTSTAAVLSWMPASALGFAVQRNIVQARQTITVGETVTGGS
jgi:hypothetical protein